MSQWVKWLLHRHKDLNVIPSVHVGKIKAGYDIIYL